MNPTVTLVEVEYKPEHDFKRYEIRRVFSNGNKMLWTRAVTQKSAIRAAEVEARKFKTKILLVATRRMIEVK
jgi:hypothetical protein